MNAFKSFNSFEEGIEEVSKISENILNALTYSTNKLPSTSEEAAKNLMKLVYDKMPSIYDEDFPKSKAISVKATEIGFKFPGRLAFGWRIVINGDKITYDFRVSINNTNAFARNNPVMIAAKNLGWQLVETTIKNEK